MQVIIGVDPHKASHTAVAIGDDEHELGRMRVRATRAQTSQLLAWAEPFDQRLWAIEGADGLGFLLAQQLITAGETVVDVPATLAARTRLLSSNRSHKNDPNDATSVAITALRHTSLRQVQPVGDAEQLRCWRSATTTSAGNAAESHHACMRCWWSSCQVGYAGRSTPAQSMSCSLA